MKPIPVPLPKSASHSGRGLSFPPSLEEVHDLTTLRDRVSIFSERQTAILAWVAHGSSDSEIARSLRFSLKTVEADLTHILRTLGVSNRVQAAVIWALLRQPAKDGAPPSPL